MSRRYPRAALALATQIACSRAPASLPGSASTPAPASASTPAPAPRPPSASVPAPRLASESAPALTLDRASVASLEGDESLRPALSVLREHFGSIRGPFDVQRAGLSDGRIAALVSGPDEEAPIALVLDREAVAWTKPRPTAGILAPARHLVIAPAPDGGVAVFVWVAKLGMVAARMWADDANPFGDFELFTPGTCDALSVAYEPALGWIVACASDAGTRAQRMSEDGRLAWGREGTWLGAPSAVGPATMVFDTPSSFVMIESVAAVGGDRVVAFRYDAGAEPLWPAPAVLGAATSGARYAGRGARIAARVARDGVVRVELPRGVAGRAGARTAEIGSGGEVRYPSR